MATKKRKVRRRRKFPRCTWPAPKAGCPVHGRHGYMRGYKSSRRKKRTASVIRRRNKSRWIKTALAGKGGKRRKGYLHRMLKVPRGKKIPLKRLRRAAKRDGVLGRRARLALTLRRISARKRRRGARHHLSRGRRAR